MGLAIGEPRRWQGTYIVYIYTHFITCSSVGKRAVILGKSESSDVILFFLVVILCTYTLSLYDCFTLLGLAKRTTDD